ncbi:MAG: PAS domain-containing protein [Chitinophagaceae bacterium]|nr:MAG: PAS domain-containing protein [Chitinophagaceae bacterium]
MIKKTSKAKNETGNSENVDISFPIVAIGASAGGLAAFIELLESLPPKTGMAFIYVQHLSPDHKSMLSSILAKSTSMKVEEVEDKVLIEQNHLYVIPPDKEIEVVNGHIILTQRPDTPKYNLPINILFTSLAKTHKGSLIGIILSGSANDGTEGVKAIKNAGGLTFAQDETAKFDSMPKSAIAAGVIDFILPPKEIANELARLSDHPFVISSGLKSVKEDLIEDTSPSLMKILEHLQKTTGVDFKSYRLQTIKRRILRRMLLYKLKSIEEYAKIVCTKKEESAILYQDFLINVTSFFRDSDTYKYLKSTILPKILKSKSKSEPLRIWIPACSTGEEVYSIAMILLEIQQKNATVIPVQIFATDLSDKAIIKARIGLYAVNELESVSPSRIQRFFTKSEGKYRISKYVREMCIFAQHNILADPPFSKLDLISCRNLFIYLDVRTQKRVLSTFHYSLNEDGFLMLGKSEAISSAAQLFTITEKKLKIYSRTRVSGTKLMPSFAPRTSNGNSPRPANFINTIYPGKQKLKTQKNVQNLDHVIDDILLSDFMPAGVVINHQMEILQFRGATDFFLKNAPGRATLNVLKMVRPEIAFPLRNSISRVIKSKKREQKSDLELVVDTFTYSVSFEVVPLNEKWGEPLMLVLFNKSKLDEKEIEQTKAKRNTAQSKDRRIKKLEEELAATHADALEYSDELETIIEELQSANEEVVSSNEEMQTVNEELETSKEEIESSNEELITTNQELQTRNDLLNESYDYAEAVVSTLHEPLIVLDKYLCIKKANKTFYKTFNISEKDAEGESLYDLSKKQLNIPQLKELLEDILPKNTSIQDFEIKHTFPGMGEKIFLLNANKIIQKIHGEELILLSFNDITEITLIRQKEKEKLEADYKTSQLDNKKLERAVYERTKKLKQANESLEKHSTKLENTNRELEAFTYISSHDLQEPLRKIQIFIGRIREKEYKNLSEDGKSYFQFIDLSAVRMQRLIKDLLAFSLISTSEKNFISTDVKPIVVDVLSELNDRIKESKAVIVVDSECKIKIIPFQFRQIFYNLISNSLKFARKGIPPVISVKCKSMKTGKSNDLNLVPQKKYCHIAVTDNGIGIDKEYTNKIFTAFKKLHSKDVYPGSGIGLAIVKKIIENHNGIVTVKSELNVGTTFDIYIPN